MEVSERDSEVLRGVAAGKTNKHIAAEMAVSEQTVKWHVSKLLRYYGVGGRAALAAAYVRDRKRRG